VVHQVLHRGCMKTPEMKQLHGFLERFFGVELFGPRHVRLLELVECSVKFLAWRQLCYERRMGKTTLGFLIVVLTSACGETKEEPPNPASPPAGEGVKGGPGAKGATSPKREARHREAPGGPPAEKGASGRVDLAAARDLLDTWLEAQNEGDFDAYAELYAERFTGVKRSGPRLRQFDQEGWLGDRRKMFSRPMKVTATGVEIDVTAASAIVRFEQTWESPTYKDVGPKRLVLVGDGAFQMTGTELSTSLKLGFNPIVVVLNNHGYTTERFLMEGPFNDIPDWAYHRMPDLLGGGWGFEIRTEGELDQALNAALANQDAFSILNVHLESTDTSPALKRLAERMSKQT